MIHLSVQMLVAILLQLVVGGLVVWLLYYLVNSIAIPDPVKKVAQAILLIVVVIWLINVVLSLGGHPLLAWS